MIKFCATADQACQLARLAGEALRAGKPVGDIHPARELLAIPDLPGEVAAFLAALPPDHQVKLHQRSASRMDGADFMLDPNCQPDAVDADHWAAGDPDACYVVKGTRLMEAVVEGWIGEFSRVRYEDGSTALVYQAQTHASRLTAAWDVTDWVSDRKARSAVAANG